MSERTGPHSGRLWGSDMLFDAESQSSSHKNGSVDGGEPSFADPEDAVDWLETRFR